MLDPDNDDIEFMIQRDEALDATREERDNDRMETMLIDGQRYDRTR